MLVLFARATTKGGVRVAREARLPEVGGQVESDKGAGGCLSHPFLWRLSAPTFSAGRQRRPATCSRREARRGRGGCAVLGSCGAKYSMVPACQLSQPAANGAAGDM